MADSSRETNARPLYPARSAPAPTTAPFRSSTKSRQDGTIAVATKLRCLCLCKVEMSLGAPPGRREPAPRRPSYRSGAGIGGKALTSTFARHGFSGDLTSDLSMYVATVDCATLNAGPTAPGERLKHDFTTRWYQFCICDIVSMLCTSIHDMCMFTEPVFLQRTTWPRKRRRQRRPRKQLPRRWQRRLQRKRNSRIRD